MRIYNPGPEINIVHGRSMLTPEEYAGRKAKVDSNPKTAMPVGRPGAFRIPARTTLDVPDQVGAIVLRVHAKDGVVRITRPTTEAKQIAAADRAHVLKFGSQPEVPVVAAPEPVVEPEPEVEKPKTKKAAKKK